MHLLIRTKIASLLIVATLFSVNAYSQQKKQPEKEKPKMVFLGEFDAGQPDAGIYKLFDPTDEVICYVLMPHRVNRREIGGAWAYEANSLGSISCVKVTIPKSDVIRR